MWTCKRTSKYFKNISHVQLLNYYLDEFVCLFPYILISTA